MGTLVVLAFVRNDVKSVNRNFAIPLTPAMYITAACTIYFRSPSLEFVLEMWFLGIPVSGSHCADGIC